MLLHHALVVVRGDDGQPLRQQVIVGVAGFHLYDLTLLADMVDILSQQELDTAMLHLLAVA